MEEMVLSWEEENVRKIYIEGGNCISSGDCCNIAVKISEEILARQEQDRGQYCNFQQCHTLFFRAT